MIMIGEIDSLYEKSIHVYLVRLVFLLYRNSLYIAVYMKKNLPNL